jgi:hypothetical protein
MKDKISEGCRGACCSGDAYTNLMGPNWQERPSAEQGSDRLTRTNFLKVIGLGALGLSSLRGTEAFAALKEDKNVRIVKGKKDRMIVDSRNRELRISSDITKHAEMPSVVDWGRRFQAWFGSYGGTMEKYFVFTTDVSRAEIDKAIQELGIRSRRMIPMDKVKDHTGLKPTTTPADYLDGDPVIVTIRFIKDGKIVEAAIEDFIQEKILVEAKEVIKPYTPHWVYHGTGEAINFQSGCTVCPSDCNGGIITDNVLPLKTTVNYYKVDWDKMPPVGSKVEVALKSIFGPYPFSSTKA